MEKGQTPVLVLIGILVIAAIAGGAYFLGKSSAPKSSPEPVAISQTPQPTLISSARPVPTDNKEAANWKTYIDKDRSILFLYPAEAKVTLGKANSMLSFNPSDAIIIETPYVDVDNQGYILDIVIEDNPQNLPAKTVIDNYLTKVEKDCSPPGCSLPQKVRSTLKEYANGEVNGYTFRIGGETDSVMVVQVKNSKTYIFRVSNGNGYATEQGIKVFDQILSTFKFTN